MFCCMTCMPDMLHDLMADAFLAVLDPAVLVHSALLHN